MEATLDGDVVRAGGDARQRFYDSRGYGRPTGDGVALAPVEAAHLLFRDDLDAVDGMGLREFLDHGRPPRGPVSGLQGLSRTGILPLARTRGLGRRPQLGRRPRGLPAGQGTVGRRGVDTEFGWPASANPFPPTNLGEVVLAVVDEESESPTSIRIARPIEGGTDYDPPHTTGDLLADRVVLWDPPQDLYERGFFGQRLAGRGAEDGPIQLSLVEAAYLAREGRLDLAVEPAVVVERGRAVEGERFDRRLRVYEALRSKGLVPKTGFKFGADFRTYSAVESVDELGHSENLVRVLPAGYAFGPRELSLDARLAGGVHKRTVFALTDSNSVIDWLAVERIRP